MTPAWEEARNLLCVRLDSVGDVLMTSPAIRALARPGRRITLLTSSAASPLGPLLPAVDATLAYDPPWMKRPGRSDRPEVDLGMIERLRVGRFDAAVVFTVYSQTPLPAAMLCFLAGIPLRLAHSRDKPYGLLTHPVPDPEPERGIRHEVRRQLDLVATVGAEPSDRRLRLRLPAAAHRQAGALLASLGATGDRPLVAVHPGASAPSRRYPPGHVAAVVRSLATEMGARVVLTGTPEEQPLVDQVRSSAGVAAVSLAGGLSLAGLAALLAACDLVVTNNTGPAHLAAAVGTPTVVTYALTNPQHTPWMVPSRVLSHDVPCRNCQSSTCPLGHHACLELVEPARVVAAASELLSAAAAPRPQVPPTRHPSPVASRQRSAGMRSLLGTRAPGGARR